MDRGIRFYYLLSMRAPDCYARARSWVQSQHPRYTPFANSIAIAIAIAKLSYLSLSPSSLPPLLPLRLSSQASVSEPDSLDLDQGPIISLNPGPDPSFTKKDPIRWFLFLFFENQFENFTVKKTKQYSSWTLKGRSHSRSTVASIPPKSSWTWHFYFYSSGPILTCLGPGLQPSILQNADAISIIRDTLKSRRFMSLGSTLTATSIYEECF